MSKIVPVVLCGGSGTRLWPRSRAAKPKPFLPLIGEETLFEATLSRCADADVFAPPVIVIGEQHLSHAAKQADPVAPETKFIVEPVGRNTAPAIALAALEIDPSDIMLVCPSDHHIVDRTAFVSAARSASKLASDDWLVAFSIEATAPETGYGYIRRGEGLDAGFKVDQFVEKPDLETALGFLADGHYAWNGGIFCFKAATFLAELEKHRPEMLTLARQAMADARRDGSVARPEAESFSAIQGDSVDYAVMEHTDRAATIPVAMGWSDIGNWDALFQLRMADGADNIVEGPGEIIGASGSMIDSTGAHVTIVGADNIVVVADEDDILVVARGSVQDVGKASRCKT